jgi:hypothetical protein
MWQVGGRNRRDGSGWGSGQSYGWGERMGGGKCQRMRRVAAAKGQRIGMGVAEFAVVMGGR